MTTIKTAFATALIVGFGFASAHAGPGRGGSGGGRVGGPGNGGQNVGVHNVGPTSVRTSVNVNSNAVLNRTVNVNRSTPIVNRTPANVRSNVAGNGLQFNNRNFVRNVAFAAPNFNRSHVRFSNYHLTHGTRFAFGYCYYGFQQPHWVSTSYCQPLGCNIYFDPCTEVWYYWCQPYGCYFPITYCPAGTYAF